MNGQNLRQFFSLLYCKLSRLKIRGGNMYKKDVVAKAEEVLSAPPWRKRGVVANAPAE